MCVCVEIWFDALLGQKGHKCGTFNINNKATGREIAKGECVGEKVGRRRTERENERVRGGEWGRENNYWKLASSSFGSAYFRFRFELMCAAQK